MRRLGWCLHAAGLCAALAAAATAYVLAFRPLEEQIADCQAQAASSADLLADADKVREAHRLLSESVARMEKASAAAKGRVPEEPMEAEFLSQLTEAAAQAGLEIKDYRPGQPAARESHHQMEIQLSCAGPYRGLCRFLERLSASPRLLRVVRMEITSAAGDATTASLGLVIYCRLTDPPQEEQGKKTNG